MLAEEPGLSAAELARAMGTTPQAANVLVARMESEQLVYREAHPTHGRILEIDPTKGGLRHPDAALPFIRHLETQMCEGFNATETATANAGWSSPPADSPRRERAKR